MKTEATRRIALASAVAGLFAVAGLMLPAPAAAEEVPCYGINKCKATGECGGKNHGCAGENECKGKGWLKIDKEKCLKIEGGRLTAEPEASK